MYATMHALADRRTFDTGRLHVVVMRPHGMSVVSARFAKLCNYTII